MDDDTDELIILLCTRAGIIMEDVSVIAQTIRGLGGHDRSGVLAELCSASETIVRLISAAEALDC